jgi:hypothetical protein
MEIKPELKAKELVSKVVFLNLVSGINYPEDEAINLAKRSTILFLREFTKILKDKSDLYKDELEYISKIETEIEKLEK